MQTSEKFLFLTPWKLLMDASDQKHGGDGSLCTQRWFVGYKIVETIRKMYTGPIGEGAYPKTKKKRRREDVACKGQH